MSKKYTLLTFKCICMNFLLELKFFILNHIVTSKQLPKVVQIHMTHPVSYFKLSYVFWEHNDSVGRGTTVIHQFNLVRNNGFNAHHMFSRIPNFQNLSIKFLCFVSLQGRSFQFIKIDKKCYYNYLLQHFVAL